MEGGRTDILAVAKADLNAKGTMNVFVNPCIPLWGCILFPLCPTMNGVYFSFRSVRSHTVYNIIGAIRLTASNYHPNSEGVPSSASSNQLTMAFFMLKMSMNDLQTYFGTSTAALRRVRTYAYTAPSARPLSFGASMSSYRSYTAPSARTFL